MLRSAGTSTSNGDQQASAGPSSNVPDHPDMFSVIEGHMADLHKSVKAKRAAEREAAAHARRMAAAVMSQDL